MHDVMALERSSYSSNLSPCDSSLSPQLNSVVKGQLMSIKEVTGKVTGELTDYLFLHEKPIPGTS
jgi:hypothetical protein